MMLFGCGQGRRSKITNYFKETKPLVLSQPSIRREVDFHNLAGSERGQMRPSPRTASSQSLREDSVFAPASKTATTTAPNRRDGSVASSSRSRSRRARSTSNGRASNAIALINELRRHKYKQTRDESVESRTLDLDDYNHFLERIKNNQDRDLPDYFDYNLRYVIH
jgi:hypothetical protein